ncbi:MAG TPA: HEAT repeat domain-containing protein [Archaeoglobaceae archaeon]|nr:HEAT repeat domain-containing protein [Archaeoglobaceae archaeon]
MADIERLKLEKDIKGLIEILMTEEGDRRMYASIALSEMGDEAVEPLMRALKEGNEDVKWEVAMALARIGEPAVEPLKKALKNDDEEFRYYASIALGNMWIQGHDFKAEE